MSLIGMMEAKLPAGFRFHPRDDELVCDYLSKKIIHSSTTTTTTATCPPPPPTMIIEVDLNKCEPWDLPEMSRVGGREWYLFSLRDRKYATWQRTNRASASGYWKATGKDRRISREEGVVVGMRKTLVFYHGRAPKGKKTDWVDQIMQCNAMLMQEDWVVCRIFYKSRGLSSKPITITITSSSSSMDRSRNNNYHYHEDACSTNCSFPLLLLPPPPPPSSSSSLESSTYNIRFGHTHTHTPISFEFDGYEQVPCFSNSNPNPNPNLMMAPPKALPTVTKTQLPDFGSNVNHQSDSSDNKGTTIEPPHQV